MSHVTDVMLLWSADVEGAQRVLTAVNRYFTKDGMAGLVHYDTPARGWQGGNKAMQCEVAMGAFNYLDIPDFIFFYRGRNSPSRTNTTTDSVLQGCTVRGTLAHRGARSTC
jgi:hypothetical protein